MDSNEKLSWYPISFFFNLGGGDDSYQRDEKQSDW